MLVGLGNDIQELCEFEHKDALRQDGYFFTAQEFDYCLSKKMPLTSFAGIFAAKEAFYKALPVHPSFFWTDLEILHNKSGVPVFEFNGELGNLMHRNYWIASVSISHSGNYASAIVAIMKGNLGLAIL